MIRTRLSSSIARLTALACLAGPVAAHERWVHHDLIRPYDRSLFDSLNWTNGTALFLVALAAYWLYRLSTSGFFPAPKIGDGRSRPFSTLLRLCPTLLRVGYGTTLLLFALRGRYLAPDLYAGSLVEGQLLIGMSAAVGGLLVLGHRTRAVALVSIVLFVWATVRTPFESFDLMSISPHHVLSYGEVLGIGAYLSLVGGGPFSMDARGATGPTLAELNVARACNRVALGATLVLLGGIKFLDPDLFMGVVQNYPEIFQRPFEELFGTSEEEVVFGASLFEVSVGFYLMLGLFPRLLVFVLGVLFTATAVLFREEVLGHLPLVTMVVTILIEGGGSLRPALVRLLGTLRRRSPWPSALSGLSGVASASRLRRSTPTVTGIVGIGFLCAASLYGIRPTLGEVRDAAFFTGSASGVFEGQKDRCQLSVELVPDSIRLNELFTIRTTVRREGGGALLRDVEVIVDVTMPQHGHGMPTAPITRTVEGGRFLTEGCRLHMYGVWLVQVTVLRNGELLDLVSIPYAFHPRT